MHIEPRNDWQNFAEKTRESDVAWIRGLSTDERFAIYADMFNALWSARQGTAGATLGDWEKLDQWNWAKKLAERERMVLAFQKLDERNRERAAPFNPG